MRFGLVAFLLTTSFAYLLPAQVTPTVMGSRRDRIVESVDDGRTISIPGNVHPAIGTSVPHPLAAPIPMQHLILLLKSDPSQESALQTLIAEQQDPKSPLYHRFLTPQQFGSQYGVSQADQNKVVSWLTSHGFTIDSIPAGGRSVIFSGRSDQIASTFKTEIKEYSVSGNAQYANETDPQIPVAMSDVVGGVVKLHTFRYKASFVKSDVKSLSPEFTYSGYEYLAPADYSTIYDINQLYSAGINGTGESIAILARSNISASDVQTFRSEFGLPAQNQPKFIITNSDPGVLEGDSTETTLDTEWSGAVAPNAAIDVIVSNSTYADGIDLSAQYAVSNNVAPIISLSYGGCEAGMGSSEVAFYNSLWEQAAAEGISVFVAAGDSGAAGCNSGGDSTGSVKGVNGLCSSPYSTCVGGTEFNDSSNPGQYWNPGNSSVGGSAISYIPEMAWNESGSNGGSGLWAGGGGASIIYTKPSWQVAPGVPTNNARYVPDVSLAAAGHDGYLIVQGGLGSVGGTSAATPSFAGLMALVDQKAGGRQGNANPVLYPLAVNQAAGGAPIFHDITVGNNSVPGVTGYSAVAGYDAATGLGSVDANVLVNHWGDASTTSATLSLSVSSTAVTAARGQTVQLTVTSTASSTLKSAVTLSIAGAPTGVTTKLGATSIASPGSGSVALQITPSTAAQPGTYTLTVTGTGGGKTAIATITLTVPTPSFSLAASASSLTIPTGSSSKLTVSSTPKNGFSSSLALSVTGLPAGVSGTFSPSTLPASSAAVSGTLTITVASTAKAGSYPFTITATGGGLTSTATATLTIPTPSFSLAASVSSVTITTGSSAKVTVSSAPKNGFSSALALSVAGLPAGVSGAFSPATLPASSAGVSGSLTITVASTATPGTYPFTITASGGGLTSTASATLTIPVPSVSLSVNASSLSVQSGSSSKLTVTGTPQNGFKSSLALSVSGLPSGASAAFSPSSLAVSATASSTLTISTSSSVQGGTYPLTITATGGGLTKTAAVTLTVTTPGTCTLASNPGTINLTAGQSASAQVVCGNASGTFAGPLTMGVKSAPAGVTASFSQTSVPAGSAVTLNLNSSLTGATAGSQTIQIAASATGFSQALSIPVNVTVPSTFAFAAGQPSLTVKQGTSAQVSVAATPVGLFNSAITLTATGMPSGVSATFSQAALAAPGRGSSIITFAVASNVTPGTYPITVSASGGGQTVNTIVSLAVSTPQNFVLQLSTNAITIQPGGTRGTFVVSTGDFTGGFNSTITVTPSGLAPGMNYGAISATAANNMVNVTWEMTAASYTSPGTYPITITATGAGVTHSAVVNVTVASTAQKH